MPTKNIAASIIAITPSFRGGVSLRICLSKSSWSRRSILMSPFCPCETRQECRCSTTVAERTLGSLIGGCYSPLNDALAIDFKKIASISTGLRRAWGCQSLGAVLKILTGGGNNPSTRLLSVSRRVKPPSPSPSIHSASNPGCVSGWGSFFSGRAAAPQVPQHIHCPLAQSRLRDGRPKGDGYH
jgi:hypothetical protein